MVAKLGLKKPKTDFKATPVVESLGFTITDALESKSRCFPGWVNFYMYTSPSWTKGKTFQKTFPLVFSSAQGIK